MIASYQRPRPRGALLALCIAVSLFVCGSAGAEEEAAAAGDTPVNIEPRGWEPALMFGFGVHSQDVRGSIAADFADPGQNRPNSIRYAFAEAEAVLFSPVLTDNAWKPRLFIRAGGSVPFTNEHLATNALNTLNRTPAFGDPEQIAENARFDASCQALPVGFNNGNCEVKSRQEAIINGSAFAGLGLDLTLPFGNYNFHLRPSVNWIGQSFKGETAVTRTTNAGETIPGTIANGGIDPGRPGVERYELTYRAAEEVRSKTGEVWAHGIGPRLEVDVEVAKVGNLVFEFFAQSGIYWMIDNRKIDYSGVGLTGAGTCIQDNPDGLTITPPDLCPTPGAGGVPIRTVSRAEIGPVIFRGGGGFRVVWKGLF